MPISRDESPRASRQIPTLDEPHLDHVVFLTYDGTSLLRKELIPLRSNRLAEAINEKLAYPRERDFRCPCLPAGMQGLYVRRVNGFNQICCAPGTKSKHSPLCAHHGDVTNTKISILAPEFFDPDWLHDLNNPPPVSRRPPRKTTAAPKKAKSHKKSKSHKRSPMLSKLLHVAVVAGTNIYHPGSAPLAEDLLKRYANAVAPAIADGKSSDRRALVLGADDISPDACLRALIGRAPNGDTLPAGAIGEVIAVESAGRGLLRLSFRGTAFTLEVHRGQWRYARRYCDFPSLDLSELAIGMPDSRFRLMAIMHVIPGEDDTLIAERVRLVVTTAQGIPVASRAEARMADYLVGAGRHFEKPMFLAKGYPYLHDFLLLDCGLPFYIEVNGRNDDEYKAAKERVVAFLEASAPGRYLVWWVGAEAFPTDRIPARGEA